MKDLIKKGYEPIDDVTYNIRSVTTADGNRLYSIEPNHKGKSFDVVDNLIFYYGCDIIKLEGGIVEVRLPNATHKHILYPQGISQIIEIPHDEFLELKYGIKKEENDGEI